MGLIIGITGLVIIALLSIIAIILECENGSPDHENKDYSPWG